MTTPIPSFHTKIKKTHSWITLVVGSVVSIIVIGFQAAQFVNTLATKQQVEKIQEYVISENVKLKQDIDLLRSQNIELKNKIKEINTAVEEHLENHVGRVAAEAEYNKAKAAAAATRARQKFRDALLSGKTLQEAVSSTYEFPFNHKQVIYFR